MFDEKNLDWLLITILKVSLGSVVLSGWMMLYSFRRPSFLHHRRRKQTKQKKAMMVIHEELKEFPKERERKKKREAPWGEACLFLHVLHTHWISFLYMTDMYYQQYWPAGMTWNPEFNVWMSVHWVHPLTEGILVVRTELCAM